MAVKFENALDVRPLDDGRNWLVLEDFYYDTDIRLTPDPMVLRYVVPGPLSPYVVRRVTGWGVVIPKGFITDFGSIPRVAWPIVGGPADSKARKGFVVHDGLYRTPGLCTRPQADSVLLECMKFSGSGWWERSLIYSAVRVGGGSSYKGGL